MARIDQLLIDRVWVYEDEPTIMHYVVIDMDNNEQKFITPRSSRLGKFLEGKLVQLGKPVEIPPQRKKSERCTAMRVRPYAEPNVCGETLSPFGDCPRVHSHLYN